ncbi:MAG: PAS domain-containing protein [Parachlamydia sp.]|nr:PAS domain-containing protein [Parachlamydia sp.]
MKQSSFQQLLKQHEPLIQAVVELFHPFVEAAVHDLKKGTVAAIYHNISQRKVGEPSPLTELNVSIEEFPDRFTPYYKTNWDGRQLKCTSITLRDGLGKAVGLICFNVDTSVMREANKLLETFLKTEAEAENPVEAFGGECETLANAAIQEYLKAKNLSLAHLNRDQKREVVQHLYRKGIFNFKHAVPFIARALHISRATVYNHLNQGS